MIDLKIDGGQLKARLVVPKDAPILHVKDLIEVVLGVKVSRQTLNFNDQELDNTRTVESYNLIAGAILSLVMTPLAGDPKFAVKVKSASKNDTVNVKESYLVENMRAKTGRQWGIPATDITMTYHGYKMEDGFPLSAYLIREDSVVEVQVKTEAR